MRSAAHRTPCLVVWTARDARELLAEAAPDDALHIRGVMRSHAVRHGAGPLRTGSTEVGPCSITTPRIRGRGAGAAGPPTIDRQTRLAELLGRRVDAVARGPRAGDLILR
jgi:hypothetical protein